MAIINGRGRVGIRRPSAAAAAPSIVLDGLKLYLDAGKTASYPGTGTVWTDISGNGIVGTFNGPNGLPAYNSSNGGSIAFDGTDDRINLSSLTSYANTQPHSYSMWVYPTAFATYKWLINNGTTTAGTSLILYQSRIGFFYQGGTAYQAGNTSLMANSWYHLVAAYNGSGSVSFYINGALDVTRTFATTWGAANSNPSIGIWGAAGSNFFAGKISNVQVYNKALSSSEILQNYDALKSRFYPQVSDADAQSFIYAANIQNSTQASAVNALVTSLKSAGIWAKMKAIYPFVGGSAASHKFNLKDPRDLNAAYRLTFGGTGWIHSSTGAKPNGTSDYANTFFNSQSGFSASNANLTYYSRTSAMRGNVATALLGNSNSSTNFLILRNDYYNFSQAIMTNANTAYRSDYGSSTNGTGLWSANRTSSVASTLRLWRNGVAVGTTPTLTDFVFPNLNVYLSAINSQGFNSNYSNHECAFASIGNGLTDAESAALYTAVQAYQTSLGRQV